MSKTKTINNPLLDEYKNKVGVSAAPTTGSYAEYVNTPGGAIVMPGANGVIPTVPTVTPTGGQSMTVDTPPTVTGGGTVNGGAGVGTAGTGGGTSGGSTEGQTGSAPMPSYDSYATWLQAIADQRDKGIQLAGNVRSAMANLSKEERDRLYEDAALARKRAVYDAGVARQQNSATYGKNAEELARMGLTGSGYSEYLEGKAIATERGDIQAANALEANAKRQADSAYREGMLQADNAYAQLLNQAETNYYNNLMGVEQQKITDKATAEATANSNYLALLEMSKTGNFTAEEISALAGKLGLSDEEVKNITSSATKAEEDKTTVTNTEMLSAITGGETNQVIDQAITDPKLREEAYAQRDQQRLQQYSAMGGTASDKFAALDQDKDSGLLTDAGYKEGNFNTFLEMIDGETDFANNATLINTRIDQFEKDGKITKADADNLRKYVQQKSVPTIDVSVGNVAPYLERAHDAGVNAPEAVWNFGKLRDGYYFNQVGSNNYTLLQIAQNAKIDASVQKNLNTLNPTAGQIAKVGDKYYLYVSYDGGDPKWYRVNTNTDDEFDSLFGNLSATTTRPKHTK